MRPDSASSTISGLTARGLDEADAKVVGAGLEVGVKTMTRDKKVLKNVPEATERF